MTLPRRTLPLLCQLACLLAWPLSAAEVMVAPGIGTLAAAIAAPLRKGMVLCLLSETALRLAHI